MRVFLLAVFIGVVWQPVSADDSTIVRYRATYLDSLAYQFKSRREAVTQSKRDELMYELGRLDGAAGVLYLLRSDTTAVVPSR